MGREERVEGMGGGGGVVICGRFSGVVIKGYCWKCD